ncbi:MAG: MoxR family ATPase [Myxococcota bacterium]
MRETPLDVGPVAEGYARLREQVGSVVVGQERVLRQLFVTLLCSSHSLVEGVPGVAKTLLVRTLAAAIGVRFGRVQFTPDLMPSDVIGTTILDAGAVRFRPGPLFTDLLLADEINRASAKTQAALLEAMQEGAATVDGVRHELGPWFCVFATQNPVEHEGTYPLPEAELDRFLFKVVVDYPGEVEELEILTRYHGLEREPLPDEPVLDPGTLAQLRDLASRVIVRPELMTYVSALVRATRADADYALGASPRAGVMLLRAAKAHAALEGRDYVLPEDVQEMCRPALRHRVKLDPAAEVDGLTPDAAVERTLRGVTVPR